MNGITCGDTDCYGSGAYCCGDGDQCCWEDDISYFSVWWTWFLFFWFVFLLASCIGCLCVRRRRRFAGQNRYIVVDGQNYNTLPSGYPGYNYTATVATTGYNYNQVAVPTAAPPTAPAYQEKPPDYSTVPGARS